MPHQMPHLLQKERDFLQFDLATASTTMLFLLRFTFSFVLSIMDFDRQPATTSLLQFSTGGNWG